MKIDIFKNRKYKVALMILIYVFALGLTYVFDEEMNGVNIFTNVIIIFVGVLIPRILYLLYIMYKNKRLEDQLNNKKSD